MVRRKGPNRFDIELIEVRSEGDVNVFWTVSYTDGKTENFYSFEQSSPRREKDDVPVHEYNPDLAEFLQSCWHQMETETDEANLTVYNAIFDGLGRMLRSWEEPGNVDSYKDYS